jgi:hypothetical protein
VPHSFARTAGAHSRALHARFASGAQRSGQTLKSLLNFANLTGVKRQAPSLVGASDPRLREDMVEQKIVRAGCST